MEKPKIILNILNKIKNPLIWIDADCYIRKLPKEFDNLNECDIGFILRNHDYKTPHSAIIYFNYNENVVRFIKKWIEKCEQEKQNILNGTYKCGDHCKLIETFNEIDDINYQFMSPLFASTNLLESMISIGISPGGHLVELNK
jgi:hypothetical protein